MAEDRLMVGVSGIRGTIGGTLTDDIARQFGCAFGTHLGAGKTVVMGSDTRPSGPMVRSAVAEGLMSVGVSVIDLGVVTTPGTALMTARCKADGGVIITASHNPSQYNGIKFLQPSGPGLRAEDANKIKAIWESGEFNLVTDDQRGSITQNTDTHDAHIEAVCGITDVDAIKAAGLKVVVDSINGAGCVVTPMLLEKFGVELVHLNGQPDGDFAHEPEPIAKNLGGLCQAVTQHGAAVGFAQDPDADRLAIVDEKGNFIGEEYTLALAAAFLMRHDKGDMATNLATSRMIDDVATAAGQKVFRSPTGEANVVQAMEENGCIIGGEGGGGVIYPTVVPVRNSLVGIAMVLQYIAETGKPLSELVAEIPAYTMLKTKMPCPADAADKVCAATRQAFAERDDVKFDDADGLRIDLPEGWLCVRASNTEPIMRIVAEARDEQQARAMIDKVQKIADDIVSS